MCGKEGIGVDPIKFGENRRPWTASVGDLAPRPRTVKKTVLRVGANGVAFSYKWGLPSTCHLRKFLKILLSKNLPSGK